MTALDPFTATSRSTRFRNMHPTTIAGHPAVQYNQEFDSNASCSLTWGTAYGSVDFRVDRSSLGKKRKFLACDMAHSIADAIFPYIPLTPTPGGQK